MGDTRHYRVTVAGVLDGDARAAFGGWDIKPDGTRTELTGELDQAALFDALYRLLALGLELVRVIRLADGTG
jgi:hypothetical protein